MKLLKSLFVKKGGMFGLDARIALAIFGSVALIAGVKIHGVVKKSNIEKIIYELSEIEKSVNAYEVDTDSTLPIITTGIFNIGELASSSKPGWKRAYVENARVIGADSNRYFKDARLGRFSILQANDRSASDITDSPFNACADVVKKCYLWAYFDSSAEGAFPLPYMLALDKMVDNSDGFLTGRVQKYNDTGLLYRLSLREHYP